MKARWLYLKQWLHLRLRKRLIHPVCSILYRDGDRDIRKTMMVAGAARSGTTWLANIIASQIPCRIMFEPFHSKKVKAFRQFNYFQYMRTTEQNSELLVYCRMIFTGDIRHNWIDREVEHIFPRCRLIKEIRANLFLKWIHTMFPDIPILFMVRHPCAVVSSRMQLGWATDADIDPFLSQPELVDDFLADNLDIIKRAQTVEEKHAVIWCISNLIPIKQFHCDDLHVVFYENLCTQPEVEIPKVFQTIKYELKDSVFASLDKPSRTTTPTSAVITGNNKVTRWKDDLSPKQISNILAVVEAFKLDYIYGDSATPLVAAL